MKKYLSILTVIALLSSCALDDEPIGGNVTPAPSDFKITSELQVSDDDVNFVIDSVTVAATFSHTVTVDVTFTGLESGATRTFTTTTKELKLNSLVWNGEHEGSFFFKEDEKVVVSLAFVGSTVTSTDTLVIATENPFNTANTYNFKEAGFENLDFTNAFGNGWFVGNGENNPPTLVRIPTDEIVPPQGDKSFKIAGTAAGGVYVTGIDFSISGNFKFLPLPADPDSLWYNVYVYGNGDPNTELYVEFKEADGFKRWANGTAPNPTDGVQALIKTDHIGWKLFSFQYSTLNFSTFAPGGGSGNKILEPDQIQAVTYNLQTTALGTGQYVEVYLDYPIFTFGAPFNPLTFKSKP